jgi:sugar phosphate isomerase/epimerase
MMEDISTIGRLSIEPLSVMGLPPVEFVDLAADLGLRHVAISLSAMPNPYGYAPFSLRDDLALRRDTLAALRDRGVTVSLGDGFVLLPGLSLRDLAGDVAVMAELGAQRVNTVTFDPDLHRSVEQFGMLAGMAADAGMDTTLEFAPATAIADLPTALDAVRAVGRPDFRLLIDTMHLFRSGSSPADLAALDPDSIGYVHLSDVPLAPTIPDYLEEACFERRVPGTGEAPLREILDALPRHLVIGIEVPLRSQADAGVGPHERLSRCVVATLELLAQLEPSA